MNNNPPNLNNSGAGINNTSLPPEQPKGINPWKMFFAILFFLVVLIGVSFLLFYGFKKITTSNNTTNLPSDLSGSLVCEEEGINLTPTSCNYTSAGSYYRATIVFDKSLSGEIGDINLFASFYDGENKENINLNENEENLSIQETTILKNEPISISLLATFELGGESGLCLATKEIDCEEGAVSDAVTSGSQNTDTDSDSSDSDDSDESSDSGSDSSSTIPPPPPLPS